MCIVQRYTILYINCWSVMHLHFCESRSVHLSAVRPLFCPNKSFWSWKQFCQFCQPRHFTSGVRSITTCSLSSAPQMTNRWIFVCSSANTSILFKAFGCLLLQLAFSTVPSILPVSTIKGTLLAASRRWGRVGGGCQGGVWVVPGSKHPSCLLPSASRLRKHHNQNHPYVLPKLFRNWAGKESHLEKSKAVELEVTEHFWDGGAAIWCELIVN